MTALQPVHRAPKRSLWLEEALAAEPDAERAEPLSGAHRADVCVVGGGYTGLWTALRLKELDPALDVVLLEADLCGSGASGRNGGFALSWWPKLSTLVKLFGEAEALRLGHAAEASVAEIGAFCLEHGIDAHFRQAGWLWTATTPLHLGAWEKGVHACEERGIAAFARLTPEEVATRAGSPIHVGGMWERCAATVQPALLARGLRRVAVERGVRVYERSPVIRLEPSSPPIVRTPGGAVAAEKVVLATNAWAASLPELRRVIVPLSSDMVATAPTPERLVTMGWTGGECITDSRLMVHYYRTTRDGRIAIGRGSGALGYLGRVTPTFDGDARRAAVVERGLRRLYPTVADVPVTHSWAGAVDRSENGVPVFGRLDGADRILYGVGFSGNGVAPSVLAGRILASSVLDRRDEWATSPLTRGPLARFPPEPIRFLGGLVVRTAVGRKEEAEQAGRQADALTRRLASLAPSGMQKGGKGGFAETPSANDGPGPASV